MKAGRIPLTQPTPPRLSEAAAALRAIEASNLYSNFGPVNTSFEQTVMREMFNGQGECLTVCNATIGLMLAIRDAIDEKRGSRRRYALMPSFTFAAAAQAALWNRLTPLFCDIDPVTWSADPASELKLLERYHDQIAVIVPYATFGYDIDLSRYERLQAAYGIPVVVDAAASLGTLSASGAGFGSGFSGSVVFSMHATKPFATGEGGLVYSGNAERMHRLRSMSNFGFGEPRNATSVGLNGKMSEVAALLACLRLEGFTDVMQRRSQLVELYRSLLPDLGFQPVKSQRQAHQFVSALLPEHLAPERARMQDELRRKGIDTANYFSPHVAQQHLFARTGITTPLPVTDSVASRVLTMPLFDAMSEEQVHEVCCKVTQVMDATERRLSGEHLLLAG